MTTRIWVDDAGEDWSIIHADHPHPDVTIRYAPGPDGVIDVFGSQESEQALVFVHGGYWRPEHDRTHTRNAMQALANSGLLCLSVEYRRIPGAPEIMYGDIAAAVREATRHVADRPTVLAGHSAGGFLALRHAERHPSQRWQRVVALAPVTDLADAQRRHLGEGAVDLMFRGVHDANHRLAGIAGCEVVVIHGDADTRVPLTMSREYCARTGAELREIPETGHFSLIDPKAPAWPVVADALS